MNRFLKIPTRRNVNLFTCLATTTNAPLCSQGLVRGPVNMCQLLTKGSLRKSDMIPKKNDLTPTLTVLTTCRQRFPLLASKSLPYDSICPSVCCKTYCGE